MIKGNAIITALAHQLTQIKMQFIEHDEKLLDQEHVLKILAWSFGTLQTLLQRNLDNYDNLESKAKILFNALDSLSTGRLNHHVILASDLTTYSKYVEEVFEESYPGYEFTMNQVNHYYDMNKVTYDSILYVHIPIFLKLKDQPTLDLFKVQSSPIPYDPADLKPSESGEWIGAYTEVEIEKEYLAMGDEIYLAFDKKELDACKTIGGVYYCQSILLMKHISEHTCESAIYHNRPDLKYGIGCCS